MHLLMRQVWSPPHHQWSSPAPQLPPGFFQNVIGAKCQILLVFLEWVVFGDYLCSYDCGKVLAS